ncbi:WbqC-like family protein [Streptomyces hygroscopicus subsp. limoneus]|nr:WbqC-like family protein [Streptomyces hygroscopicus subsp. limoneus]
MPGSPADSSPHDLPAPGGLCAIHQPNFLPRLHTLAKLFAADYWIVLDDVQFARRDYQHRARLPSVSHSGRHQWLSIPTHLPHGRSTAIRDATLVEPERSRRRVMHMLAQQYGRCPDWQTFRHQLDSVLVEFRRTDRIADVAETSTRMLLNLMGWRGRILYSSSLPARSERSQRLADLAAVTRARGYLCGTGGGRYLEAGPFAAWGIAVIPFRVPTKGLWEDGRTVSAVHSLMNYGIRAVSEELCTVAHQHWTSVQAAQLPRAPVRGGSEVALRCSLEGNGAAPVPESPAPSSPFPT